jgi:putative CocE/NonD family hydrolase
MSASKIPADLERMLIRGDLPAPQFSFSAIRCETVWVTMRDGVRLATDTYIPPVISAPVVAMRTPYGRDREPGGYIAALLAFARRGYVVVSQDCRGTGSSEPDTWDYYVFESDDSYDLIDWISRQSWFGGFIGSCGDSYVGQTQWAMAVHPAMSAIVPSMSGLGIAVNTAHLYMFLNAYARADRKSSVSIPEMERMIEKETMAGGYFNEPLHRPFSKALLVRFPQLSELAPQNAKRWLWKEYCEMSCAQRAMLMKEALDVENVTSTDVESATSIFGHGVSHDAFTLPHINQSDACRIIKAPPLLRTGWYDWGLNDALATWEALRREAQPNVGSRARMIITPYAHNMPGYREGASKSPELICLPNLFNSVGLLLRWYSAVREGATEDWPTVMYYLMGANVWQSASDWPLPEAIQTGLYLAEDGMLSWEVPTKTSGPDCYTYDPHDPTPTVGGNIVSYVYTPGGVDVSGVQHTRSDVQVYTSEALDHDLDVVGPLRMILYASSSARDTDFVVRFSDVFPDGRAIQLQSGILRARYRDLNGEPELLEPGRIYRLEIDLWATANRFKVGHRLRVDISSADFPHFDRNSNRGGEPGPPIPATQSIYRDPEYPSHLLILLLRLDDSIRHSATGCAGT